MKGKEIEQAFVNYFKKKDHLHLASGPIVVKDNPTLMFNSAGMVQFRHWFHDVKLAKHPRVVTSQKCLRAGGKHNDLDNVGYTPHHHTFFKMLGNFSFGDYFKEEAIKLAWDFLVKELGIDQSKLSITVHNSDSESRQIWTKILNGESRITDEGDADNFWSMGESGPCGPCTEIFYQKDAKNEKVEIWNLVFMEYNQTPDSREKLAKPCVDTGMGLERITAVIQDLSDNYETDLIFPLVKEVGKSTDAEAKKGNLSPSLKVVADHFISASFLIHEGIQPSNEKEGYVLRKIIRRGFLHIMKLNKRQNLLTVESGLTLHLTRLEKELIKLHPELKDSWASIKEAIETEGRLWNKIIKEGIVVLEKIREAKAGKKSDFIKNNQLTGEYIFKLEDTYGIPIELTQAICEEVAIGMDMKGYENCVKERERISRSSLRKKDVLEAGDLPSSSKVNELTIETVVSGKIVQEGQTYLAMKETPFHPQGGGQVGDKGCIQSKQFTFEVNNTLAVKNLSGDLVHLHQGKFTKVSLSAGDSAKVTATVDQDHRMQVARGHTATHILNQVLCEELGQVLQRGSHITSAKFTFDFTCNREIDRNLLKKIENRVNWIILKNSPVVVEEMPYAEAMKKGAKFLPGDAYGDLVQVVGIADTDFISVELCGGTHTNRTGDIGMFKIVKESSISRGVRRMEVVVGGNAISCTQETEMNAKDKILRMEKEINSLKRDLEKEHTKARHNEILFNMPSARPTKFGLSYFVHTSSTLLPSDIRPLLLELGRKIDGIHLVHCTFKGKASLGVSVPKSCNFNAVNLLEKAVSILGGTKPSGNELMAQGGGGNSASLEEAIKSVGEQLV